MKIFGARGGGSEFDIEIFWSERGGSEFDIEKFWSERGGSENRSQIYCDGIENRDNLKLFSWK